MSDRIVFLKPYGPEIRDERRRRRHRQQRFCCCMVPVLIVLVGAVVLLRRPVAALWKRMAKPKVRITEAPVAFPLQVKLDKVRYRHYDLVRIRVVYVDSGGTPISDRGPSVVILHNNDPVPTVGGMERVPLHYDRAAKEWAAAWPIPWNAPPGPYLFRATARINPTDWPWLSVEERRRRLKEHGGTEEHLPRVYNENKSQCVALAPFEVLATKPQPITPGLGALVLEATWDLQEQPIPLPEGGNGDWHAIFNWCDFLGANGLWYSAGYTEAGDTKLSMDRPWQKRYMDMVPMLAAEAKRRGIQFGPYALGYRTFGEGHASLPPYDYAWDLKGGTVTQTMFVSLDDVRRRQHLADWTRLMAAPDGVSYTGLDYIRTGSDGYEMVDEFVRDMSVSVPAGWQSWPRQRRMTWLHDKVAARSRNTDLCDRWDWFRAHKTSLVIHDIIGKSGSPKPLWCFILGWDHGKQHGQDPVMFADAGAGFDAVMLYELQWVGQHDYVLKRWGEYMRPGQANLVVGDTVSWYLHQSMRKPRAAPEELYRRITTATHMVPGELAKGVFIHDLSRILTPARTGPYPGKEWAIAGAAAIAKLRMDRGMYPVRLTIEAPSSASIGGTFTAAAKITNLTKETLHNVRVELMPAEGVKPVSAAKLVVGSVAAQGVERAAFQVVLPGHVSKRADRFLLAVRVTWPQTPPRPESAALPQHVTAIRYVDGV
jgi:hypothetical protein